MHRLYLVRSVAQSPRPSAKRSAKVIALQARREQRRAYARPASQPDRPDAA